MISATRREIDKITTIKVKGNGNSMGVGRTLTIHQITSHHQQPQRLRTKVNSDASTRRQIKPLTNDRMLTVNEILMIEATT